MTFKKYGIYYIWYIYRAHTAYTIFHSTGEPRCIHEPPKLRAKFVVLRNIKVTTVPKIKYAGSIIASTSIVEMAMSFSAEQKGRVLGEVYTLVKRLSKLSVPVQPERQSEISFGIFAKEVLVILHVVFLDATRDGLN